MSIISNLTQAKQQFSIEMRVRIKQRKALRSALTIPENSYNFKGGISEVEN